MRGTGSATLACVALLLIGCGDGGDDLLDEGTVRDCLADRGLAVSPADLAASVGLGNVSPDFRAHTEGGVAVDVVVQKSEKKAQRTAADIQGALQSFGAAEREVLARKNVVAVFDARPSEDERAAVEGCIGKGD